LPSRSRLLAPKAQIKPFPPALRKPLGLPIFPGTDSYGRISNLRVPCPAPNQLTQNPSRRPCPPVLRNSRRVEFCLDRSSEQLAIPRPRPCRSRAHGTVALRVILGSSRTSSAAPVELDEFRKSCSGDRVYLVQGAKWRSRSQANLYVAWEAAEPHHANQNPLSFLVHCGEHSLAAISGESAFEFELRPTYLRISSDIF
jgi:hypothetical protein